MPAAGAPDTTSTRSGLAYNGLLARSVASSAVAAAGEGSCSINSVARRGRKASAGPSGPSRHQPQSQGLVGGALCPATCSRHRICKRHRRPRQRPKRASSRLPSSTQAAASRPTLGAMLAARNGSASVGPVPPSHHARNVAISAGSAGPQASGARIRASSKRRGKCMARWRVVRQLSRPLGDTRRPARASRCQAAPPVRPTHGREQQAYRWVRGNPSVVVSWSAMVCFLIASSASFFLMRMIGLFEGMLSLHRLRAELVINSARRDAAEKAAAVQRDAEVTTPLVPPDYGRVVRPH